MSRLTVRQHRFVRDPQMAWASGVLFERNGTNGTRPTLADGPRDQLRARGPERKALLSAIAADVDAINESIEGLPDRVDQWIPCRCSTCQTAGEPHFYAQKKLLQAGRGSKAESRVRG